MFNPSIIYSNKRSKTWLFSFSYHSQTLFKFWTKSDDCLLLIPLNFKAHKLRFNFLLHDTENWLLILWQRFPALCVYFDQTNLLYSFFCVWQKLLFLNFKNSFLLLLLHQSAFLILPWRPVWRFHVPMFHNKLCCRKEKRQKRTSRERIFVCWLNARAHENEKMHLSESNVGRNFFSVSFSNLTRSEKSPASAL